MNASRRVHCVAGAVAAFLAIGACSRRAEPDAYGNVEATEVIVGAEASGRLVSYTVNDGDKLAAGATVGAIDATQISLERDQLAAQHAATASRVNEVRQQIQGLEAQRGATAAQRDAARAQRDALVSQHEIAKRAYDRTNRLVAQQAATTQQLDQAERDYRVLGDQIKAQDEQIKAFDRQIAAQTEQVQMARAQEQTVKRQVVAAEAQVSQAAERIRKAQVTSPIAGTVLTTYVKAGEVVQIGQPLFKIASLESVEVRAYVSEPQLAGIRLGQEARVSIDTGRNQRQTLQGTIAWISSQAEFTPTNIQTREERADLVYAIKIRVPNEHGILKIGMPADVEFAAASAAR
jgi:HlyD family secretion protein